MRSHKKAVVNKPLFKFHERKERTEQRRENYGSAKKSSKDDKSSRITCGYCKKPGHIMADCFIEKRKKEIEGSNPAPEAFISHTARNNSEYKKSLNRMFTCKEEEETPYKENNNLREEFLPFITNGYVSENVDALLRPIKILRDTGAAQSLLLEGIIDNKNQDSFTLVQGIEGKTISVSLRNLYLKSSLVTRHVQVGLMTQLPIKGISLMLGNDLAGEQVVPNLELTSNPVTEEDDMDKEIYASCAVTRSMNKESREENVEESTFDNHDQGHEITHLRGINLSDIFKEASDDQNSDTEVDYETDADKLSLSREKHIIDQRNDEDISYLRNSALTVSEIETVPAGYYVHDELLMRKWRPCDVYSDKEWAVVRQIVAPTSYRKHIIELAQSLPLGGHLGVNKTYQKLLECFIGLELERMWQIIVVVVILAR